jgi:putative endonuclease
MFSTYAIKNEKGRIYIGHTENLEERLGRHNKELPTKRKSYTYRNSGNWQLFYKEEFSLRADAIRREKELKSFRGREFLKNLER